MSTALSEELAPLAREAAASACWTQWIGLGSLAVRADAGRPRSIVDPEALILLSVYAADEERRLLDMVAWWAETGSHLTSLQRLKALADRFPAAAGREGHALFSTLAFEAGDRRWRKWASNEAPAEIRQGKGPGELQLVDASALWPRLRAGFGVGAKADALVFLIGLEGAWASVNVISYATGYSGVSIRKATREMALARLIRETEGRPVEYLAPPEPWAELLNLYSAGEGWSSGPAIPPWRFWSEIFSFLIGAVEWAETEPGVATSEHVRASRARDLMDRHERAFSFNGIPVPPPDAFRGRAAAEGLLETVRAVASWMEGAV